MTRKKLARFAITMIVAMCPFSTWSQEAVCEGKYKDGGKPTARELAMLLNDHIEWLDV